MARIKPQTLLLQSKKKKGPARINATTIIICNLVAVLLVLSIVATYWNWSQRFKEQTVGHLSDIEVKDPFGDVKKYDLPGYAVLNTSKGLISVELYKDGAPGIVDKFLELSQKGLLNGMAIQRVIKHYVIQGGSKAIENAEDWTLRGKLNGQYTSLKHEAFMLGTSRTKNGDDFDLFITTAPIPDLNEKLIVFGHVVKGVDVVQEIEEVDTDEHYRPKSRLLIHKVTLKRRI